jgi:hypothetical protein
MLLAGALLAWTPTVHAHRLEADYHVLPDQHVQIESWFDLTGESPRGAKVQVLRASGTLLTEGVLDGKGLFVFPYREAENLKVIVSAGGGHRKELDIPAVELRPRATTAPPETTGVNPVAPAPQPLADRSTRITVQDVLTGVGFVLAVAAFVLSLRNARQLRDLHREQNPCNPSDGVASK